MVTMITPVTFLAQEIQVKTFGVFARLRLFINAARGRLIGEKALISALRQGQIRAAGLDVFQHEPLAADSPLLTMSNVVATPHIGSATLKTRAHRFDVGSDDFSN
jgi:phosphoglycerate dehydrogenase-like enzyme